jgi:hypothetical protein
MPAGRDLAEPVASCDVHRGVLAGSFRGARGAVAAVAAVVLASGRDDPTARTSTGSTPTAPSPSQPEPAVSSPEAPPPVTVRFGDRSLELLPWTYCYANGCVDGIPPADPPDVGSSSSTP